MDRDKVFFAFWRVSECQWQARETHIAMSRHQEIERRDGEDDRVADITKRNSNLLWLRILQSLPECRFRPVTSPRCLHISSILIGW